MQMENSDAVTLARILANSSQVLVFTGAGISTGSGIPDFRGPTGVWTRRQPVYYQDFMSSEAARIEHWDYKLEGWPSFCSAAPNPVHQAVARLEQAGKVLMVVTQNIDGLHTKAGTSPERLVELHGSNLLVECQSCGKTSDPAPHFEFFRRTRKPPVCRCGGFLKPATISFGQALREADLARAFAAAEEADCVIALGSSLSVYPAAAVPLQAARRKVPYVIINRGPTEHDSMPEVTLRYEADLADLFPAAVALALSS
jgi:NAD-dependent deacetylase